MSSKTFSLACGEVTGLEVGDVERAQYIGILLHGKNVATQSSEVWRNLLTASWKENIYLFALDMPGYGNSREIADLAGPIHDASNQGLCLSIIEELFEQISSKNQANASSLLFGKSWGGALAIEYCIKHPNALRGLFLSAPAYWQMNQNGDQNNAENRLRSISTPTLIAWALDDQIISYEPSATRFTTVHPELQLITYEHGNHDAAAHNANDFVTHVHRLLEQ